MMNTLLKQTVKALLPPIVLDSTRIVLRPFRGKNEQPTVNGQQQDAAWYDTSFEAASHWHKHYSDSKYYPLWCTIADRIITRGYKAVLDIGCGPGQFASLIRDRGVEAYWGVDFSEKRIEQARQVCPQFNFHVEDAFETDKFETLHYEAVVMTEVLEHVHEDYELLKRIRKGSLVLASVPDFPCESHVRHFDGLVEVRSRYESWFRDFRVDAIIANEAGKRWFIFEGIKT